jgi:hypothetical protein
LGLKNFANSCCSTSLEAQAQAQDEKIRSTRLTRIGYRFHHDEGISHRCGGSDYGSAC